MGRFPRSAMLAVVVAVAACTDEPPASSDGVLQVTSGVSALELTNLSRAPVHYAVFERGRLAFVDWATCMGGPPCPTLAARVSVSVAYTSITGYTGADQEGVVFWWWEVAGGPGYALPDSIHGVVVSLRGQPLQGFVTP